MFCILFQTTLFHDTEDGFKRALSLKFNTYTYSPGQILAKPGEINQNAYYIEHGVVQVHLVLSMNISSHHFDAIIMSNSFSFNMIKLVSTKL